MKYLESFDQKFGQAIMRGIPNDRFWEFVDKTGWKKYCDRGWNIPYNLSNAPHEIDNILENIAPYFTFEEFREFSDMYDVLYEKLDEKLKEEPIHGEGFGVSDDGYTDLLSSIIGMGKRFYKDVLMSNDNRSFRIVRKMVDNEKYQENFGYIFSNIFNRGDIEDIKQMWERIYRSNNYDLIKKNKIIDFANSDDLNRFWKFVEKVNWWKRAKYISFGKDFVLTEIAPYFSHDEFKKFRNIYKELDKYLKDRTKDIYLSAEGDDYWDLRSSIIGFGKNLYLNVIEGSKNNYQIKELDSNNDYYENFGYIFSNNEFDITDPEIDYKKEWDKIYKKK